MYGLICWMVVIKAHFLHQTQSSVCNKPDPTFCPVDFDFIYHISTFYVQYRCFQINSV